jgi:hypothetical protein
MHPPQRGAGGVCRDSSPTLSTWAQVDPTLWVRHSHSIFDIYVSVFSGQLRWNRCRREHLTIVRLFHPSFPPPSPFSKCCGLYPHSSHTASSSKHRTLLIVSSAWTFLHWGFTWLVNNGTSETVLLTLMNLLCLPTWTSVITVSLH